ncbi:hypothetical protein G5714_002904 [Onychostoma macrolepis]|uniref:Uncharacterized protein n=1 Tax=Onychostoma macrolepis TaxID=369639 RepID=A0A7J6D8Q2_9TELE|nr:hypothetical protein G5714_002904 [Onychostoma macrolepis]
MPNLKRKRQDEPFPCLKATTVRKRPDKAEAAKLPVPPKLQPKFSHHPTCDPSVPPSQDLPEDVEEPPRPSSMASTEYSNAERQPWTRPSRDFSMPKDLKETMQVLLQKVDSLAASQREILLLLRRNQGRQREDDILDLKTDQCKEELEDLENHLKDPEFRKKVKQLPCLECMLDRINKNTYVCSEHFVNRRPTPEYPNPIAALPGLVLRREHQGACRRSPRKRKPAPQTQQEASTSNSTEDTFHSTPQQSDSTYGSQHLKLSRKPAPQTPLRTHFTVHHNRVTLPMKNMIWATMERN